MTTSNNDVTPGGSDERMGVQEWIGMYLGAQKRFEDVCMAVLSKIAEGGTTGDVIDVVGDWMDGCDCLDDEVIALFRRAAVAAVPPGRVTEETSR